MLMSYFTMMLLDSISKKMKQTHSLGTLPSLQARGTEEAGF